jgi:hypothetical protein
MIIARKKTQKYGCRMDGLWMAYGNKKDPLQSRRRPMQSTF